MRLHTFLIFSSTALLLFSPLAAFSWGPDGHRIVGVNAVTLLDPKAHAAVIEILGGDSEEIIGEACYWPDVVRKTPEWEWSAPFHYVNIPRSTMHYERERDCEDGLCVTEAIVKYANNLTLPGLDDPGRRQAFSWLCHLVGDLHQPLHAGYRDDLGGNTVEVEYRGESGNLHQFWDRMVIRDRLRGTNEWERPFSGPPWVSTQKYWNPESIQWWTDESHALVTRLAYPASPVISEDFADQTWLVIRQQWQKASNRLAGILNATLGEGEVQLDE
jgi:hypothetical protein